MNVGDRIRNHRKIHCSECGKVIDDLICGYPGHHAACRPCDCGRRVTEMRSLRIVVNKNRYVYDCPCLEKMDPELRRIKTTEGIVTRISICLGFMLMDLIDPIHQITDYIDTDTVRKAIEDKKNGRLSMLCDKEAKDILEIMSKRMHIIHEKETKDALYKLENALDEVSGNNIKG